MGRPLLLLEFNPLETNDGLKDSNASITKNLDVILLPKVNTKNQIDLFIKK